MINNVRERNPMPEQAREVRCTNFNEVALGYTEADAIREAMRCLNCRKKPCVAGCPIHQQIPEFIARVAEGDFEGAYDIITVRSTMPSICGRVCPQEQQCERTAPTRLRVRPWASAAWSGLWPTGTPPAIPSPPRRWRRRAKRWR
ncbi:MAG: hypothetical protein ACLSCQ_11515 [Evtepia gabavorous]